MPHDHEWLFARCALNSKQINMKQLLLLLITVVLLSLGHSISAQNYLPIGAKWHYQNVEFNETSYHTLVITNDTMVIGTSCRMAVQYNKSNIIVKTHFLKQDGSKILYYNSSD